MVLTFNELRINVADFNGMTAQQARAEIVNIAADAITIARYGHPETSVETLYDWANATVNFVRQYIVLHPVPYYVWMQTNS